MKKAITILKFFLLGIALPLYAYDGIQPSLDNSFYHSDEFNLYTYDINKNLNPPPPPFPQPEFGGGSVGPGAPDVTIVMYMPLLFFIAIYMIYKTKIKSRNI